MPVAAALDEAAAVLARAERPAIVAGGGASGAADGLRALAERLGAPVITSINGKGALPYDHPLSVGAGLAASAARELAEDADAVLVVGCELAPSDLWWGPLPFAGEVVRIDVDPAQLATNAVPDGRGGRRRRAGAGGTARAVERLAADDGHARAARFRARLRSQVAEDGARWTGLLRAIGDAAGAEGIVVADNAMVAYNGALGALPAPRPRSFLFPTGYGTLGYAIPAAIGAKVGRPGRARGRAAGRRRRDVHVGELAAAAQAGLALAVVVVDNGGYGEIRHEMRERGDEPLGVDFDSPDFAAIGRAMGCRGVFADSEDAVREALERALAADRPTVIHVPEGRG